jgi:hypothetical protein
LDDREFRLSNDTMLLSGLRMPRDPDGRTETFVTGRLGSIRDDHVAQRYVRSSHPSRSPILTGGHADALLHGPKLNQRFGDQQRYRPTRPRQERIEVIGDVGVRQVNPATYPIGR